jgi:hypothetical protein
VVFESGQKEVLAPVTVEVLPPAPEPGQAAGIRREEEVGCGPLAGSRPGFQAEDGDALGGEEHEIRSRCRKEIGHGECGGAGRNPNGLRGLKAGAIPPLAAENPRRWRTFGGEQRIIEPVAIQVGERDGGHRNAGFGGDRQRLWFSFALGEDHHGQKMNGEEGERPHTFTSRR